MSLADLGSIGEFIGSIAVIISLIYVAIQVRDNTRQLVRSELNQAVSLNSTLRMTIGNSGEYATLIVKGSKDLDSLDQVERLRFDAYMEQLFYLAIGDWVREQSGVWEPGTWNRSYAKKIRELLAQNGAKQWWRENNEQFREEFRQAVESLRTT